MAEIRDLSHDGLGVATVRGKTVFIEGGLPTELVNFTYVKRKSKFDIGKTTQILKSASFRTKPLCAHYETCGGCALQHVTGDAQIQIKQNLLIKQLKHFGLATPEEILPPIRGPFYQYRRRARLSVKYNEKDKNIELGFKEKLTHILAPIHNCEILDPTLSSLIPELKTVMGRLGISRSISEIEMARGDTNTAVVIRHLKTLTQQDQNLLVDFAKENKVSLYLHYLYSRTYSQSDQVDSVPHLLWSPTGQSEYLSYSLPAFDLTLQFHPLDFVQVNSEVNQAMVSKVMDLLNSSANDSILDLFCGLGNFTLPLARKAGQVVGVEGSASLVERGNENAKLNGIANVEFHRSNLQEPRRSDDWARKKYDKLLLDPPRSGALELMKFIPSFEAKSIVYISCDPATLARDIGELIKRGYRLQAVGIMDMFPQTRHIESIAQLQYCN